jgi:hypothetical protein
MNQNNGFWLDIRCKRPDSSKWLAYTTPSFDYGKQTELSAKGKFPKDLPSRHSHTHLPLSLQFSVSAGLYPSCRDLNCMDLQKRWPPRRHPIRIPTRLSEMCHRVGQAQQAELVRTTVSSAQFVQCIIA